MTYEEWETKQLISPSSPEAYYAELAWNYAVKQSRSLVAATKGAESNVANMHILQDEELSCFDTGLGYGDE